MMILGLKIQILSIIQILRVKLQKLCKMGLSEYCVAEQGSVCR